MDGKLLVLCSERPTIDEYGNLIDKNRNLVRKTEDGKYINSACEEVDIDENKRVVNTMDLTLPVTPESIQRCDIIYADWETVVTSDIEPLKEMIRYSATQEEIPLNLILDSGHQSSIIRKAYANALINIDRPKVDYSPIAMSNFMQLLADAFHNNDVVTILPAFSKSDSAEIVRARSRVLESFGYNEKMKAEQSDREAIEILPGMIYEDFGEVYVRAQREMMKIMSKPYPFESPKLPDDDDDERAN